MLQRDVVSLKNYFILTGAFFRPAKWEALMNELNRKSLSRHNTRFYLYTRHNAQTSQELCINDLQSLSTSHFDRRRRTIIMISGWFDNRFFAKWVREGIRHFLERADFNVIYVAWRSIKELFAAAKVIKRFSDELAEFLQFLKVRSFCVCLGNCNCFLEKCPRTWRLDPLCGT